MGKAGRRKQTWGSKRLYRVATSVLLLIYSTSEETNCIGDDGEFVCTRERHRKIILQWLMSKVTQIFYWILTWTMKRKQQILKSQCSALSHTSLWPKKSVRKKKPTQVINRGNLSTILLWTTSVDFIRSSCYRVVNGPLESISSDLASELLSIIKPNKWLKGINNISLR